MLAALPGVRYGERACDRVKVAHREYGDRHICIRRTYHGQRLKPDARVDHIDRYRA